VKIVKPAGFFIYGIITIFLAGCFNPIIVSPPKWEENPLVEPFTVDVLIGKDTVAEAQARSVDGPDAGRIKGDVRNILQLIVVDKSGKIAAFDEVRRGNDKETEGTLRIETIAYGETYHFLLLMGHWERDYKKEADGEYKYTTNPPTLLAAGLKRQEVTGGGKVTISMWPVVVDTVFTTGTNIVESGVHAGKPGEVNLLPVNWDVTWTIKRGVAENGLRDLVAAQKLPVPASGDTLLIKGVQTLVRDGTGVETWSAATLNGNVITRSIKDYTEGFKKIGTTGSVNFKMEYIPYNLTGGGETNPWAAYNEKSAFDLRGNKEPVWIIRNGVNDLAQDGNTDFLSFHHIAGKDETIATPNANGNGAVRYKIEAKTPADSNTLVVKDGIFIGPTTSTTPGISFTTGGYKETAEVYYAVIAKGDKAPDNSAYNPLATVAEGKQRETITVPKANGDYDVYVKIYKDGEVSAPHIINTARGSGIVD
jgi:hypothetical protein